MDNLLPKDIFHPLDTDHIINKKISSLTDQKKYDKVCMYGELGVRILGRRRR